MVKSAASNFLHYHVRLTWLLFCIEFWQINRDTQVCNSSHPANSILCRTTKVPGIIDTLITTPATECKWQWVIKNVIRDQGQNNRLANTLLNQLDSEKVDVSALQGQSGGQEPHASLVCCGEVQISKIWSTVWPVVKHYITCNTLNMLMMFASNLVELGRSVTLEQWFQAHFDQHGPAFQQKGKGKEEYSYSAIYTPHSLKAVRHGSYSFNCKLHHACLSFVSVHQMASPLT